MFLLIKKLLFKHIKYNLRSAQNLSNTDEHPCWEIRHLFLALLIDDFFATTDWQKSWLFWHGWLTKITIFCCDCRFCFFLQCREWLTMFVIFINSPLLNFGMFFHNWLTKFVIFLCGWQSKFTFFSASEKIHGFYQWSIDEFYDYFQLLTGKLHEQLPKFVVLSMTYRQIS